MTSIASLTCVTRRLNELMKDWKDYPSQPFFEQAMDANSNKDKLKKLSDGIQNAVIEFLVSLRYRTSAHFNYYFPIQVDGFADIQLKMRSKEVRILFALNDCILVFLTACSFPA